MTARTTIANAVAAGLFYSGAYRLLGPIFRGVGCVFALHKIATTTEWNQFGPMSRYLSISEELFEMMIRVLTGMGYEIVTMTEVYSRLSAGCSSRPFVCFTFDDGYRDNYQVAFKISRKYKVPIVVYVTTGLVDQSAAEWWRGLEVLIAARSELRVPNGCKIMKARTGQEKTACYQHLTKILDAAPVGRKEDILNWLGEENSFDLWGPIRSLSLDWDLMREMQESGLVEFGAHTVRHLSLASLGEAAVAEEMSSSAHRIGSQLGVPVRHFAYPYGTPEHAGEREFRICRDLGFHTGVTTRHSTLTLGHGSSMHALPRLTLNGHFAKLRNVKVFASGSMTVLQGGPWFRRP